jgi:biopolymer transport protein TolQ
MENVINIAANGHGLSYWSLVTQASLLVQLVMLLLLLASLFSWTVIFAKRSVLKAALREADDFEDAFWSGGDTTELYNRWTNRGKQQSGMAGLFVSGYREYSRLAGKGGVDRTNVLDGVQRAMRVALAREIDSLENHLSFLATVGSTSPYVGLFGTVWGIMNSFRSLGTMQQATIASVAPGIAEALVATAMGLFAAIPAVIAYNRYSNQVERLVARYETFIEEFVSIVGRQSFAAPAVAPAVSVPRADIHAA